MFLPCIRRPSTHNVLPPPSHPDSLSPDSTPPLAQLFSAPKDVYDAPVDALPHPEAALQLLSPKKMHIRVLLVLERSLFLFFPPCLHNKPQFFSLAP